FIMVKNHPVDGVSRLNPSKYDWKIQVKVLCLWEENCLKLGPSLEMVIVDIQVIHVGKFDNWDHVDGDDEQKDRVQVVSKSSSVYVRHLFKFICRDGLPNKGYTSNSVVFMILRSKILTMIDGYMNDGYGDVDNSEEEEHESDESETETDGYDDGDSDEDDTGYNDTQEGTDGEEEYDASESNEDDDQKEADEKELCLTPFVPK
ncbi:uncharacterized protein LOC111831733, partial [Capsella rubella]|uniref:uncharacterized protein LOC111831733 n=1 Tax=Capsella rubella TaxID=81985 RepID=UPI000CD507BF